MPRYTILAAHPDAGDLWIAGRRIPRGETSVELTEAEAAHDLQQGSIVPEPPPIADGDVEASQTPAPVKRASGTNAGRNGL